MSYSFGAENASVRSVSDNCNSLTLLDRATTAAGDRIWRAAELAPKFRSIRLREALFGQAIVIYGHFSIRLDHCRFIQI
jgi:hypothetical protein